jgi:serine/threonine-protein phosphatase 2A regulatory subunit A
MMDQLVSDGIPNIRFNVAKSYAALIDVLKRLPDHGSIIALEKAGNANLQGSKRGLELINNQIMPNLAKLQVDDDMDVRYFATTAAERLSEAMVTSP